MDEAALLRIAGAMADRLRVWKKMQVQAQERGETVVELHPGELFEAKDQAALDDFEAYVRRRAGEVPLLPEALG